MGWRKNKIRKRSMDELYAAFIAYFPVNLVTGLCCLYLEYGKTPILHLMAGGSFTWFWAYWIHRLHHNLPSTGIGFYLNPHISIHHSHEKLLPRWLDLFIETIHNIVWFFFLYILQELTQIHIVPTSIIVLSMLVYSSVHVINYSMFGSEKHRRQHEIPDSNYGPDFLDHVFGTNSDPELEDMSHFIPNSILSTLLIKSLCFI